MINRSAITPMTPTTSGATTSIAIQMLTPPLVENCQVPLVSLTAVTAMPLALAAATSDLMSVGGKPGFELLTLFYGDGADLARLQGFDASLELELRLGAVERLGHADFPGDLVTRRSSRKQRRARTGAPAAFGTERAAGQQRRPERWIGHQLEEVAAVALDHRDLDERLAGIDAEREPYRVREGGSRLCFVRDPDQYRVELLDRSGA